MEEKLSLDELMATLEAVRDKEHRQNKFMAALKGVDLDADKKQSDIESLAEEMARIEAEENGTKSSPLPEKSNELTNFGIAVVERD